MKSCLTGEGCRPNPKDRGAQGVFRIQIELDEHEMHCRRPAGRLCRFRDRWGETPHQSNRRRTTVEGILVNRSSGGRSTRPGSDSGKIFVASPTAQTYCRFHCLHRPECPGMPLCAGIRAAGGAPWLEIPALPVCSRPGNWERTRPNFRQAPLAASRRRRDHLDCLAQGR